MYFVCWNVCFMRDLVGNVVVLVIFGDFLYGLCAFCYFVHIVVFSCFLLFYSYCGAFPLFSSVPPWLSPLFSFSFLVSFVFTHFSHIAISATQVLAHKLQRRMEELMSDGKRISSSAILEPLRELNKQYSMAKAAVVDLAPKFTQVLNAVRN